MRELNEIYMDNPAFYEGDYDRRLPVDGLRSESRHHLCLSPEIKTADPLAVFNFSNKDVLTYELEMPDKKQVNLLLHSDWECFGGTTTPNNTFYSFKKSLLKINVKGFSAIYFTVR